MKRIKSIINIPQGFFKSAELSSILILLLLFTSCASDKEFIIYNPIVKEKYFSRDTPAEIGNKNEEFYIKNGYLKIGMISVKLISKKCFDKCESFTHSSDSINLLLKKAADQGGDIVILLQNDESGSENITKKGKCLRSHMEYGLFSDNGMLLHSLGDNTLPDNRDVCDEYEILNGTEEYVISTGSVWRLIDEFNNNNPDKKNKINEK